MKFLCCCLVGIQLAFLVRVLDLFAPCPRVSVFLLFPGFRLGLHPPHFSFRCALQLAWSHLCWCHFFRRDSAFLQLLLAACQDAEALDVPLIFTVLQPVLPQDLLVLDFASFTGYYPFAATASSPSSCAPALCRHGVIGFWSYGYVLPAGAPTEPSPYLQSEILRRAGCGNPARHSTRITVRAWIAKVANLKFLLEEGDVDGALQLLVHWKMQWGRHSMT